MSEEQVASIIREFVGAMVAADIDSAVACVADDVRWVTPEGTFDGKAEIRRYIGWTREFVQNMSYSETGIGLMVQGDHAAYEHLFQGDVEGTRVQWLALCSYELAGDKIQSMRTVYDRLGVLQQAASGWLEETMINAVVKRAEKGLH